MYRLAFFDNIVVKQLTEYSGWLYQKYRSIEPMSTQHPFLYMDDLATYLAAKTIQRSHALYDIAPHCLPKTKFVFVNQTQEDDKYYFTIVQEKIHGITLWDLLLRDYPGAKTTGDAFNPGLELPVIPFRKTLRKTWCPYVDRIGKLLQAFLQPGTETLIDFNANNFIFKENTEELFYIGVSPFTLNKRVNIENRDRLVTYFSS